MSYQFLLDIALILISTKALGLVVRRYHMPQVVGALLAGLILGPAMLNILHETDFLKEVAELGVIVMMFSAGIETDLKELGKVGKAGLFVALCGVLVPLIMGFLIALFFNRGDFIDGGNIFMQNVFLGVVLTATSVSITVETLQELGKLSTKVGTAVLAASLIDDILGLIALTIVTSMSGADVNILLVLGKIILFFVLAISFGFVVYKAFTWYVNKVNNVDLRRFPIIAFVVCLILAYCAEEFFGIADIIGAFIAGLIVSNTSKAKYIASKFRPLSYLLLTPVFFASIGIKVEIPEMNAYIIFFTISLVLVSFLSKIIGCGLGAKLSGFKMHESVQIGIGMVSRGEVALIIANKGLALRLLNENFFGPIIILVVFAAVLTPILLKLSFRTDGMIERPISDLVKSYEKVEKINYLEDKLLDEKTIIK